MFQQRVISIFLLVGCICSTSKAEKTPIFFGEVMGESATGLDADVLYNYLGIKKNEKNLPGEALSKLSKEIIDTINKSDSFVHYSRPIDEYSELPDELLLLVISIESVNKHEILINNTRGTDPSVALYPELALSLQIADPRSGQIVYSDFTLLSGYFDFKKTPLRLLSASEQESIEITDRAFWNKNNEQVDWEDTFRAITELASLELLNTMLHSFNDTPIAAEVVRKIGRNHVLVNKGRSSGLFNNARLSSDDSEFIFAIDESYMDYSVARLVKGNMDQVGKWLPITGYQSSRGSGTTLTAVSRVVLSPDVLLHPKLVNLAVDESLLEKSLSGVSGGDSVVAQPINQSLMSAKLTQSLSDTGAFRMMYPVSGLRSMNNAKIRMDNSLNMKKAKDDPFFFSSLVIPDQVVVGIVANPILANNPVLQNGFVSTTRKTKIIKIKTNLYLCDLHFGSVLASGRGTSAYAKKKGYVQGTNTPLFEPASSAGLLIRRCVVGEKEGSPASLQQSVNELSKKYSSYSRIFGAQLTTETTASLHGIAASDVLHESVVDVCIERGQLALHPDTQDKTTLLKKVGVGVLHKSQNNEWAVKQITWLDDPSPEGSALKIPVYGLNAKKKDVLGIGEVSISGNAKEFAGMSDADAACLLASEVASLGLPIKLPLYVKNKVDTFHQVKFFKDGVYRDSESIVPSEGKSGKPAYTVSLQIRPCNAPVINVSDDIKTLDVNCGITLQFHDKNGVDVCNPANASESKKNVVNTEEYEGDAFASFWVENTLPNFLNFFITKRMEPALN
jgi:hypothetical protein